MIQFGLVLLCFLPTVAFGNGHGAHVHGQAKLDMAVDQNQLLVMVQAPAESFFGFEYKPKTEAEKKKAQQAEDLWRNNLTALFDVSDVSCKVTKTQWKQEFSSASHSEIKAEGYFDCAKPLRGKELVIKLKDQFERMLIINYQLIRSDSTADSGKKEAKTFQVKL